jgi:hypothetical protein
MLRNLQLKLFVLLMAFAVGSQQASFAKVAAKEGVQSSVLKKANQSPHTELKLVQELVHPAPAHPLHKWNGNGIAAAASQRLSDRGLHSTAYCAYTLLLVKDYLFFIYPSHHFW